MEKIGFQNTFSYKLIYVFSIYDDLHKGILKIGETTIKTNKQPNQLYDNCNDLNNAAKKRIRNYTNTIGVMENLLYTTLAINNKKRTFKDKAVHNVLYNSGIKKHDFQNEKNPEEWFETDLKTVINAINATKQGKKALTPNYISTSKEEIQFRPEQLEAIRKTVKHFKTGNRMLWNAKMRFGKTLSALEVIKQIGFSRTIILTHRPVVNEGWFEDFKKIFHDSDQYLYGSKKGTTIDDLIKSKKKFIYFASIQDLRESSSVGGKFDKNNQVFHMNWDFVVIDEAHEGTQTSLGTKVLNEIIKDKNDYETKVLFLSGTPFNLLNNFEDKEIYTWDYIMEQQAKLDWDKYHPLETNPYLELPRLNIFTYNLSRNFPGYIDVADTSFNFKEFFKVWTGDVSKDGKEMPNNASIGEFVHKKDVERFLDLMCKKSEVSNYPFSKDEYINNFHHTFWIVPGIKEAHALTKMLREHPNYKMFEIVDVAGTGNNNGYEALEAVEKAIGSNPENTYTITISCGKLTTGVTVKAWTAVFYLAGSYSTSASNYLQTIFRVQSPANYDGKIKTDCYVFDFAPDRALKMIAQAGDLSIKAGATGSKEKMKQFLNFCPVISVAGSTMERYDVGTMLQQLKKAYAERVANNGFDDTKIYNDKLIDLNPQAIEILKDLEGIIGKTKQTKKITEIDINNQGFTDAEIEKIEEAKKIKRDERTEEQKILLEELKEKKKQRYNAISILRGISIRIPLLIYGADLEESEDITPQNFTGLVDDLSWNEFMPKGVTKEMFKDISKFYDKEIFIEAGRRIRNRAKYADTLSPIERAKNLADLFSTFKNPDKETVLTPWKTVNMHMGDTIGGYNFFDDKYIISLEEPRFINNGEVTIETLVNTDSHILEINSKTGLYPLYVTVSLFKQRCLDTDSKKLDEEVMHKLWKQTVENNIFILCKTPMAKKISKRTLVGFNNEKVNIIDIPNMLELFKDDFNKIDHIIHNPKTWGKEGNIMKFDAIVGNPPYQEGISNSKENSSLSKQLFPTFIEGTIKLNAKYVSLITPSRWFSGDAQDKSFIKLREFIKNNNHISNIYHYPDEKDLFSNVEIKGGVNYFLYQRDYNGLVKFNICNEGKKEMTIRPLFEDGMDIIISDDKAYPILKKVKENNFISITTITKGRNAFGVIGKDDFIKKVTIKEHKDGYVPIRCKANEIRFIEKKLINKNLDIFNSYKVFISKSAGSPNKDLKVIGTPYIGKPNEACTDSLIPIGCFKTYDEALNLQKYMKTKFLRFMVGILKVSQNVSQNVYQFVPLQDFTNGSDINWNMSIKEIDDQLYKKYNLNNKEIEYIEGKIKEI